LRCGPKGNEPAKVQTYILGDVDVEKLKQVDKEAYFEYMDLQSRRWLD
jgi:hypothetical protein